MSFPSENLPTSSEQSISATQGSTIRDVNQGTFSGSPQNVQIGDNKFYASSNREELNNYIKHAVTAYSSSQFSRILPSDLSSPYKLLDAFRVEDESIFFGREQAVGELCKAVQKARLTVLHARSGAGKSSLLQAGLSPNFIRRRRLPLYIRTYDKDPGELIKQALAGTRSGWPDLLSDLSLHEFFTIACSYLPREHSSEFLLILDQFEDFFLYKTEATERLPFIKALGECSADQNLPLRIVLALRKDYYSDLAEFDRVLPSIHIFRNYYQPLPMTRQEAQAAIVQPLTKMHSTAGYDPALLEVLLNDLERGEVELPLLQILCTRLYETRPQGERQITLERYQAIGGMEGVLKSYLLEVLNGLPERHKKLAQRLLKSLLRSDGTKQALSDKQLHLSTEAQKDELENILGQLVRARLLRRDEIESEIRYELVHDYLAAEIGTWIDSEEQGLKQAEELLRRELMSWRTHHTLIPRQRLEILFPYRKQFKQLDMWEWEGLLTSVLKEEYAVGFWILATEGIAEDVLAKIAKGSAEGDIHARAVDALVVLRKLQGIESLIRGLQDEDARARYCAAESLGELGGVKAVDLLIETLHDGDWEVRLITAEALGNLGEVGAVEPLIKMLHDENSRVRRSAATALSKLGKTIVEPLSKVLHDENVEVRREAARALGELREVEAVEPLSKVLQDEDVWIRRNAAISLCKLEKVVVEPLLIKMLQNEDVWIQCEAARALGELGEVRVVEPLSKALQDRNWRVRCEAARALGKLRKVEVVELLSKMLHDEERDVRQSVVEAFEELGEVEAVEPLIEMLHDEDEGIRCSIAEVLGKLGKVGAVEPLINVLHDEERDVRRSVVEALGRLGETEAIGPLIKVLQDEDVWVRVSAAEALGKLGKVEAVEPLIKMLYTEKRDFHPSVTEALGKLGKAVVEPLIKVLQDEDVWVRVSAAEVLAKLGEVEAVEPLIKMLQDEDVRVRRSAVEALSKLGKAVVEPLIKVLYDEDVRVRRSAVEALSKLGKAVVEPLIKVLYDEDVRVRCCAVEALGELGEVEAVEPLIKMLYDEEQDVRRSAVEALGKLGETEAAGSLIKMLYDEEWDLRLSAIEALGKLGEVEAVEPLIRMLQDEDVRVRRSVVETLGKLGGTEVVEVLTAMLFDSDEEIHSIAAEALSRLETSKDENVYQESEEEKESIMDVARIAASAVALLAPFTPYLVEAGKAAGQNWMEMVAEKGGDAAWEKVKLLWEKIHAHTGEDKKLQGAALMVSADPEDESMQTVFAKVLGTHLEADPAFAEELVQLMGGSQAVQEVIADHQSFVENVKQQLKGAGKQTIRASDNSAIRGVRQSKE